ncbi:MAG: FAD/NAD(P)-binding oxidoreductase, partial [Nitrososphaeria archaeon]|nr:FAD/NAD(P)-binding oxidoreductase [Nitrososphaeria archaeon]
YVINAAGLFADEVSAMAGIDEFKITPRKGEYVVYDKDLDGLVNRVLFPIPSP